MEIVRVQQCQFADPGPQIAFVPSHSVYGKVYALLIPDRDDLTPDTIICECDGYQFRGYCSHQHEAAEQVCSWRELDGPENQNDQQRADMICPRCGNETEWVLEAVDDL